MLNELIKNIKNEITEYKKAMDDDFTFKEEKGDQAGGPETSKVDRKSGPETRNAILRLISENAGYGFNMKFTTNSLPRDILVVAAITKSSQLKNRSLEFLNVVWQRVIPMADLE